MVEGADARRQPDGVEDGSQRLGVVRLGPAEPPDATDLGMTPESVFPPLLVHYDVGR